MSVKNPTLGADPNFMGNYDTYYNYAKYILVQNL